MGILLLKFNSKLEDLFVDDDGSPKSCLFMNMSFLMVGLITLFEKYGIFNHVILIGGLNKRKKAIILKNYISFTKT
jgi:hypothetical protein